MNFKILHTLELYVKFLVSQATHFAVRSFSLEGVAKLSIILKPGASGGDAVKDTDTKKQMS